jgi:opine dehydrogenase
MEQLRFAVLGAGHGGMAMAGHLGIMGYPVKMFNRSEARLKPIQVAGGIEMVGEIEGFGKVELATANMAEAVSDVDVLMVVVPANAHRYMATQAAPYLQDGQLIILNPGRTGGAFEFRQVFKELGVQKELMVAEAQTLLYACRSTNPAQVKIFSVKNSVPVAALPGNQTVELLKVIRPVFPQFVPGDNVVQTSLDNIGAIFHPALMVLNAARVESTRGDFQFYFEGITKVVSFVLERLDQERVAVAAALGIKAMTAREWLYIAYDAHGKTLYDAIKNNIGYKGILAPPTIDHRYLWEDVPMSLVPIASMGDLLGVGTPTIKHIIDLAELMNACDYWTEGRTIEKMGLSGLSHKEIRRIALEGFK